MKSALILLVFLSCANAERKIASVGTNTISINVVKEIDYRVIVDEFKKDPEKLYQKILENEVDSRFYDLIAREYFTIHKLSDKGILSQIKNSENFYQNQILILIKDQLSEERILKLTQLTIPQLPPAKDLLDETRIALGLTYNERNFRLMKDALEKNYFLSNTEAITFAENFFKKNLRMRPQQSIELLMSAEKYFVPVYRKKFLEILLAHVSLVNDEFFINTVAKRLYDYYPRTQYRSLYQRHIVLRMDPEESRMENDLVHRIAKKTSDLKTRDGLVALLEVIPPSSYDVQLAVQNLSEKYNPSRWNTFVKAVERNYFFENEKPKELIETFLNKEEIPKEAKLKLLLASSKYFENDKNLFIEQIKLSFSKDTPSNVSLLKKFIKGQDSFLENDFVDLLPKSVGTEVNENPCTGLFGNVIRLFRTKK